MNKEKNNNRVLKICFAAAMAALVFAGSQLQVQIPAIVGFSRFHLGNIMCALSGLLLGPWWGGLAAGVGSAMFDMTNPAYISDVPFTLVMKFVYGMVAGLVFFKVFKRKSIYITEIVASLAAAVAYAILYLAKTYFYKGIILSGLNASAAWLLVVEKVPSTIFNGVVAVIFAPILGIALNKALEKAHLLQKMQ